jgi:hypothetical protein
MPREDLIEFFPWVVPDAYERPWPWNDTEDMGKPPGTFLWDSDRTILTYKHMENDVECLRTWNRANFASPYVTRKVAGREMENYCRERNMLDNEYRKLSKEVLEFVVGDRTTITSGSLFDGLFDHHWKLKQKHNGFIVLARINNEDVELPRYLLRAQPGEIVRHRDGNPLNNTKENIFVHNATPEGEKQRSLGRLHSYPDSFDDVWDDYQSRVPFPMQPKPAKVEKDITYEPKPRQPITSLLFGPGRKKPGVRKIDPNAPPWKQPLCTDYCEWDNTAPREHTGDSSFDHEFDSPDNLDSGSSNNEEF